MPTSRRNLTSPNGNVRTLLTYRKAEIIYDLTFYFAHTFLSKGDRTVDQMIQAARSGKQNIAEGSAAGVTSMETAIKLTNVAKASFLELRLDYEDFLRVRNFRQWEKDSEEVRFLREKSKDTAIPDMVRRAGQKPSRRNNRQYGDRIPASGRLSSPSPADSTGTEISHTRRIQGADVLRQTGKKE